MKSGIHPNYKQVKITCSCGNSITTGSTLTEDEIRVETCSKCHPFYTGTKTLRKADAVDKFRARQEKTKALSK